MNIEREISIIIPVHNEALKIHNCLEKTIEYCEKNNFNYEIIIAEDGSTDNTVEIVKQFQEKNDRIQLLSLKERAGKGQAICNAMTVAKMKYVGFMDADLAAKPDEFKRLLQEIKKYDIVIGSRILRGDLPKIERPFYRTLFSFAYSKFFRALFHIEVFDPQCGFKLFRKEIIPKLLDRIQTKKFAFDSEIIVKAYMLGISVKEIPIIWNHDAASKIQVFKQVKEMGSDILSVWVMAHKMWKEQDQVYPQKKGSLMAEILFRILSINRKSK